MNHKSAPIAMAFCFFFFHISLSAHSGLVSLEEMEMATTKKTAAFMMDCENATAQIDLKVNNVRARLLNGGDVWWDLSNGSYFVPKAPDGSGFAEVSSIFAGAVWLGGIDPGGNLKLSAVQYRSNGNTDFYPGPLDAETGLTDPTTCNNWDRFFAVDKDNIEDFNKRYAMSVLDPDLELSESDIPEDVKYWPAKGNPFFFKLYNFELPNTGQGLASFWDENTDGIYNPLDGDFPILEVASCNTSSREEALNQVPDQMIFWIFNDAGGAHTESDGVALQMEIQALSFAYSTTDQLNDATFYKYKLINRAKEDILDAYFALWTDFDLGCSEDDLIGCKVDRNLAYAYNLDALDGDSGTNCSTGATTYGANIPMVGVDYLRSPLSPKSFSEDENGNIILINTPPGEIADTLVEVGMSSFIYINRQGSGPNQVWTFDPSTPEEYYNYMQGLWRDGRAMTFGDCGYTVGSEPTKYAFPGLPNKENEWSMCTACTSEGDRRSLQSSGPFLLSPGAVNEMILGVVWVPDIAYPCPDIERFLEADDAIQDLFDNCFEKINTPDAPDLAIEELDRELILTLSNDSIGSNNYQETFTEIDPSAPVGTDNLYRFEGYKIFQLANQFVSPSDLDDIDKARLVTVFDKINGIQEIVNWTMLEVEGQDDPIWVPEIQVQAMDVGISHTINITTDLFAEGNSSLQNGRKYYFTAIAYAHNEWQAFNPDPAPGELHGQATPYIQSDRNVKVVCGSPDIEGSGDYGENVQTTRLSGVGVGSNFVSLEEGEHDKILNGTSGGTLKYKTGQGPLDIRVYDPEELKDGVYRLRINGTHNGHQDVCGFEAGAIWELFGPDGLSVVSEQSIDEINEQIIEDYGFAIGVAQTDDAGDITNDKNGAIGARLQYNNPDGPKWYRAVGDDGINVPAVQESPFLRPTMNFLKTSEVEVDNFLDPNRDFSQVGQGYFYPYYLSSSNPPNPVVDWFPYYITPAWNSQGFIRSNNGLEELNNVDLVLTSDKSKWSRCIVVETNNRFFKDNGLFPIGDSQTDMFDLRQASSVDKEGNPDGDGTGLGWFPGYAIDVETGKRLNVFFGENSYFDQQYQALVGGLEGTDNGDDMLFNPTNHVFTEDGSDDFIFSPQALFAGGHHTIFVTRTEYDECASLKEQITENTANSNLLGKINVLRSVTWTSIPLVDQDAMLSYANGYIPNDLLVELRVDNPYNLEEEYNLLVSAACNPVGDLPEYEFTIDGTVSTDEPDAELNELAKVEIYPNPMGINRINGGSGNQHLRFQSLPNDAYIKIYDFTGQMIRTISSDEIRSQASMVEWDLRSTSGQYVQDGIYYIQIGIRGTNKTRTIKWIGI